jgi:HSP90 family molecular chaperone
MKGNIAVQSENIFPIIKKFLYSDQEIFLRELISNVISFNVGKSQLNKMFDEIIQLDKDKYQQLIDFAFKEKNDWIAININGNRHIYRMFDKIIFENK